MDGWNTTFLLGRPIFRGYVSFREGSLLVKVVKGVRSSSVCWNYLKHIRRWSCITKSFGTEDSVILGSAAVFFQKKLVKRDSDSETHALDRAKEKTNFRKIERSYPAQLWHKHPDFKIRSIESQYHGNLITIRHPATRHQKWGLNKRCLSTMPSYE